MPSILGVHSNVSGDGNGLIAGHAWISVTSGKKTVNYGLWPDDNDQVKRRNEGDPDKSDLRIGYEDSYAAVSSRYYQLSTQQETKLNLLLNKAAYWATTNNCSSWAHDVVLEVVKEDVDADDWLGIETPRELGRNIDLLEMKDPTSLEKPKIMSRYTSFDINAHQSGYTRGYKHAKGIRNVA